MTTNNENGSKIFKALSDTKRLAILELLQSGEKCACDITDCLGIPQSALSYHMKILCAAEIVENRHYGKWIYYKLNQAGTETAIKLLKDLTTIIPNPNNSCRCCK